MSSYSSNVCVLAQSSALLIREIRDFDKQLIVPSVCFLSDSLVVAHPELMSHCTTVFRAPTGVFVQHVPIPVALTPSDVKHIQLVRSEWTALQRHEQWRIAGMLAVEEEQDEVASAPQRAVLVLVSVRVLPVRFRIQFPIPQFALFVLLCSVQTKLNRVILLPDHLARFGPEAYQHLNDREGIACTLNYAVRVCSHDELGIVVQKRSKSKVRLDLLEDDSHCPRWDLHQVLRAAKNCTRVKAATETNRGRGKSAGGGGGAFDQVPRRMAQPCQLVQEVELNWIDHLAELQRSHAEWNKFLSLINEFCMHLNDEQWGQLFSH